MLVGRLHRGLDPVEHRFGGFCGPHSLVGLDLAVAAGSQGRAHGRLEGGALSLVFGLGLGLLGLVFGLLLLRLGAVSGAF